MKVRSIKGPWFSFGFHIDFKHRKIELHFIWWIITIGNAEEQVYCGYCLEELTGSYCDNCKIDFSERTDD